MKSLLIVALVFLSASVASAAEWEYKVVYLPVDLTATKVDPAKYQVMPDGSAVDIEKSNILNSLSSSGWEVLAVVGNPGVQAVYLRRPRR